MMKHNKLWEKICYIIIDKNSQQGNKTLRPLGANEGGINQEKYIALAIIRNDFIAVHR
jgi:hypothetical protein